MNQASIRLPHSLSIYILSLLVGFIFPSITNGESLTGRVESSHLNDFSSVKVAIHENPMTKVTADWNPVKEISVSQSGTFALEYEPTADTELEFFGPGVRRARFPWPQQVPEGKEDQEFLFPLAKGYQSQGVVIDANGNPVEDALIGPVVAHLPEDAPEKKAPGPFYTTTKKDGSFELLGLDRHFYYSLAAVAEGHQREHLQFSVGEELELTLEKGGHEVKIQAIGEKTQEPLPNETVVVSSGEKWQDVFLRTDEEGIARATHLSSDVYTIFTEKSREFPHYRREVDLPQEEKPDSVTIEGYQGTDISGTLVNLETDEPVGNLAFFIGEKEVWSEETGEFLLERHEGPWPARVNLEHERYEFQPADQSRADYPIAFLGTGSIDAIELRIRPKRLLEVDLSIGADNPPDSLGRLMLHLNEANPSSHRENRHLHILPELKSQIPLRETGSWNAYVTSSSGLVTERKNFQVDTSQTTTTLELTLNESATFEGSLRYEKAQEAPSEADKAPDYTALLYRDGQEVSQTKADEKGEVVIEVLPPGKATAVFKNSQNRIFLEREVELSWGQTATIEEVIPRGHLLKGKVVNEEEQPVTGAKLEVYTMTGASETAETLAGESVPPDGSFRFEQLQHPLVRSIIVRHDQYQDITIENYRIEEEPLVITMKEQTGVAVRLAAENWELEDGNLYLLRGRRQPVGRGQNEVVFDLEQSLPTSGKKDHRLIPESQGLYRVAFRAHHRWALSREFSWQQGSKDKTLSLSTDTEPSLELTWPEIDRSVLEKLEIDLINLTLPSEVVSTSLKPDSLSQTGAFYSQVPPGDYLVSVYIPDRMSKNPPIVSLLPGDREKLSLELANDPIELVIELGEETADGIVPVKQARIKFRFQNDSGPALFEETTDRDGLARAYPIDPGSRLQLEIIFNSGSEFIEMTIPEDVDDGVLRQEIVLPKVQPVRFDPSPEIASKLEEGLPVIVRAKNGSKSLTLLADSIGEVQYLPEGVYRPYLGERLLEEVSVEGDSEHAAQTVRLANP